MKLTIGMPTLYDYSGTVFTVQALRELSEEWENFNEEVEIIVVDNTPSKKYRDDLKSQITQMNQPNIRYIEFLAERGPAEVKNQVIATAKGEYTMCIDCHVLFKRGTLKKLKTFLETLTEEASLDFYTGPLLDNAGRAFTHFSPVWRGQMYGIWATDPEILKQDKPVSIWGNGCGLFLVKTKEWLGFNKNFKGFGAEEGYIHDKYRKFGRDVKCIPWLTWWHRFGNPDAKHYNLSVFSKVRNYVLGHLELGMDLKPIYDHFVSLDHSKHASLRQHLIEEHGVPAETVNDLTESQLTEYHKHHKISLESWEALLQDPISNDTESNLKLLPNLPSYSDILTENKDNVKLAYDMLGTYAKASSSVCEITDNIYSIFSLQDSGAESVTSLLVADKEHPDADKALISKFTSLQEAIRYFEDNLEVDMLYITLPKDFPDYEGVLHRVAKNVRKYLFVNGTKLSTGDKATGQALKLFSETSDKHVYYHTEAGEGMTVFTHVPPENEVFAWYPDYGAGTELKKLLGKIGIHASATCSCNGRAFVMDMNGIEWCESNTEMIVSWLREEAEKRKLPYIDLVGKTILSMAIKRAKKARTKYKKELAKKAKNARDLVEQNV